MNSLWTSRPRDYIKRSTECLHNCLIRLVKRLHFNRSADLGHGYGLSPDEDGDGSTTAVEMDESLGHTLSESVSQSHSCQQRRLPNITRYPREEQESPLKGEPIFSYIECIRISYICLW